MNAEMTHVFQIARNAATNWLCNNRPDLQVHEYKTDDMPDAIVLALDRAGLLATPAMRQAAEACKRINNECAPLDDNPTSWHSAVVSAAMAGRALLAEEAERAPKPRWVVVGREIRRDGNAYGFCSFETEQQAEAVGDCLNRLEVKP